MIDQDAGAGDPNGRHAGAATRAAFLGKPITQPVVRALPRETAELSCHRARNRLAAVDNVIDGLARNAGRLAHGDLIEAKPLDLGAKVCARSQAFSVGLRVVPAVRGHSHAPGTNIYSTQATVTILDVAQPLIVTLINKGRRTRLGLSTK